MTASFPSATPDQTHHAEDSAAVKAAAGWVQNLARTLKTCRLYDASNPAVIRFRGQLHESLTDLLAEHGTMALRFTSDDVLLGGVSLYPARSRDDNLALAFFRDGVRGITFRPGLEREELDVLLDGLLAVTGAARGEDDLVTLLWQANLTHVEIEHITAEGDILGPAAEAAEAVPWPTASVEEEPAATDDETAAGGPARRSDDWDVGAPTGDLEAVWRSLHEQAAADLQRFQGDYVLEREAPPVSLALAVASAYAAAGATPDDLLELARFLPRVLRMAIADGDWSSAASAMDLLDRCGSPEWSPAALGQELNQPISVAGIVQCLDAQDEAGVGAFIALAHKLEAPGVDLLNLVMVELQNLGHRATLAESIVETCREQPEHLAAWLADPRAWVVQNVVLMLARIGGPSIVGLLRAVTHHPDARVRYEVVAALREADPDEARPVLARMIDDPDSRTLCAVLQALWERRDPELALALLQRVKDPAFERRPEEERRAIYLTLSTVAGDESVAEIEAELQRVSWLNRGPDPHRQALGRCLARIGTPAARAALERGAKSKKPVVRKACEDALQGLDHNG